MIKTVGSVCSGIEAASVAWIPLGLEFKWFSEIALFPSQVLKLKYPDIENVGDMSCIPEMLVDKRIEAPDLICGGTPCQAFSLAGWQNGLNDDRGNLTLKFVDIINANDEVRQNTGKNKTVVFWENVEGVLTDKTNAFGCMISSLAGLKSVITLKKWPSAGLLRGPLRNVAWRVMDAKYFGLPQQRKRLYLMAGGKDFKPEEVLFEAHHIEFPEYPSSPLSFSKDGHKFEVFREYTDCLYASYGTKWNGNAAATNGSLFVVQDGRIRRVSPLECERLMGFPDNYTDIPTARRTNRYQATGNSWAVPVITWIGKRLFNNSGLREINPEMLSETNCCKEGSEFELYDFGEGVIKLNNGETMNCSIIPEEYSFGKMMDIVSGEAPEEIYISPVGCRGILRRKMERNTSINPRLATVLESIASEMPEEEIEKRSRRQRRGRLSVALEQG